MQKEIVWVERGKGRDAKNVKNSEWVTDFDVYSLGYYYFEEF